MLLGVFSCAPDDGADSDDTSVSDTGAVINGHLSTVRYVYTWDLEGVTPRPEGGIEVTNDLGWVIELDEGWLVNFAISLVPCSTQPLITRGHGGFTDPSAVAVGRVEPLTTPGPTYVADVAFASARYCEVHWLMARATQDAVGLPDTPDLVGQTLWLTGTATGPEGALVLLSDRNNWADGAALAFTYPEGNPDTATVTVTRELGSMFDGIDFASLTGEALGQAVLANLTDHASVDVTAGLEGE